ncbi:hypothetical protein ARMSODRAFT_561801 [Armillaria solidipes]|uniref:Uncharacterized protein n=1 Tax=Armillaria solidipes TaxID=1076256 RepID=A0A2H3B713_9AGAR|nr:hypothetical protein ARMSODRAFT_561801 [Armillaria solidipes]
MLRLSVRSPGRDPRAGELDNRCFLQMPRRLQSGEPWNWTQPFALIYLSLELLLLYALLICEGRRLHADERSENEALLLTLESCWCMILDT